MNKAALQKLAKLTEARKARDLAAVDVLLRERTQLEVEIEELNGTGLRDAAEGTMPFTMLAQRTRWVERQITLRQRRIDAIAAEIAQVRAVAKISVGRDEALGKLIDRAAAETRRTRARAEELAAPGGARPGTLAPLTPSGEE